MTSTGNRAGTWFPVFLLALLLAVPQGIAGAREWRVRPARSGGATESSTGSRRDYPCYLGAHGAAPRSVVRPMKDLARRIGEARRTEEARAAGGRLAPRSPVASDIDTMRVAFLRCDFRTDRGGDSTSTPDGRFDLRTGVTAAVDAPPHNRRYFEAHGEALRRFFRAQSFGHLELASTVFPSEPDSAFHLGDTMDYGPWAVVSDNVNVAEEAERLIKDALEAAHRSGQVDFSAFDAFIVVHAGADFQSDVNGDSPGDIPTFVLDFGEPVTIDGQEIDRAMVLPETTTQDGFSGALNGVLAHEFGHILGLVDLYNTLTGLPSVGYWSIMDSGHNIPAILVDTDGSEVEVYGALPTSYDPWSRLQLFVPDNGRGGGFLASRVAVVEDSLATPLPAVLTDSRLLLTEIHDGEYYLVENRAQELDGNGYPIIKADHDTGVLLGPVADSTLADTTGALEYDALLPSGGMLVWHIDDRVLFGDLANPYGVNVNIWRRGVRVVEADGIEDQGRRNLGTPWDPFYRGNNMTFGPFTVPRTESNDGQFTRIEIATSSPPGPTMDVTVRRPTGLAGWPIGLSDQITVSSMTTIDLTGDHSPEMVFPVGRDLIAVEGRGGRPYPESPDPGTAVSWARINANFGPRLASDGTHLFGWVPVTSDIRVFNALDAGATPVSSCRGLTDAATPPAILEGVALAGHRTMIGWAGRSGRAHLAGFRQAGVVDPCAPGAPAGGAGTIDRLYDSAPLEWNGQPDPGSGNVVVGPIAGSSLSLEVAWLTESGRVHVASTANAQVGGGVDGADLLSLLGSSASLGQASRLSLVAAGFTEPTGAGRQIAVVDRSGRVTLVDRFAQTLSGWPVELPAPLIGHAAAGDIDGDGSAELVVADTLGNVHALNGDGREALGWPKPLGARATSGAMLAELDSRPGAEVLIMSEDGSLHAFDRQARELTGFPLAMGGRRIAGPELVDLDHDGRLDMAAGSPDHLLLATGLDATLADSLIVWAGEENGPGRNALLRDSAAGTDDPGRLASRAADWVCFPNPARGARMSIRCFIESGQRARVDVFDMLGRPVAEDLGAIADGSAGEATVDWNLADVSPGIYLVRLEVIGGDAPAVRFRTVSVLR